MINPNVIELLNKELDGLNSERESARVRSYLAENPEAQHFYNELANVHKLLSEVEEVVPPANLKKRILNAIEIHKYAPTKKNSSPLARFVHAVAQTVTARHAFAFSSGLVLGLLLYAVTAGDLLKPDLTQPANVSGTIGATSSAQSTHDVAIDLDGTNGTVSFRFAAGLVFVQVDLRSDREVELEFRSDSGGVALGTFTILQNSPRRLDTETDGVRVTSTGRFAYTLSLVAPDTWTQKLTFRIYASKMLLYEKTVSND